jgi:hypothetical protein
MHCIYKLAAQTTFIVIRIRLQSSYTTPSLHTYRT